MTSNRNIYLDAALAWLTLGYSTLPPREDGSKAPLADIPDGHGGLTWSPYQTTPATPVHVEGWYRRGLTGVGLCGGVGGLEPFEFDDRETYERFKEAAQAVGLDELVGRIEAGYCEESPSGGIHWLYVCEEIRGPEKLAQRPIPGERHKRKTLIETKGQGGFIIVAPSGGKVHPTGGSYRLLRGRPDLIEVITSAEREALWDLARSFDEMPVEAVAPQLQGQGRKAARDSLRPGDDFNDRMSWEDVLEPMGWVKVFTRGNITYWRRPGKDRYISATTGYTKGLYVFSTSTPFKPRQSYSKFAVYALINHGIDHGGDYSVAARELAKQGFGSPPAGDGSRRNGPPRAAEVIAIAEPDYHRTDTGNAERMAARHRDRIRHCHPWGKWLIWDGRRWAVDDTAELLRLATETTRSMLAEAATIEDRRDRKSLIAWAMTSESRRGTNAMIALAAAREGIPILPADMDRDGWQLNVEAGTLDLRTGRIRPHDPGDLITQLCPVAFDPMAACPLWESVVDRVFAGQGELIAFVRRLLGMSLTATTSEQILPIWWGTGSNGKSTMLGAILEMMGSDYAISAPPGLLIQRYGDPHPTERAILFRKRLVIDMESAEGAKLNETMVKQLTGSDRISARKMREDFWDFAPTHKIIMGTNHKPTIKGTDHAIWRRVKLVPFTVEIPEEEQIKDLPNQLRLEYPGILNWCLAGCLDWQRNGLNPPEQIVRATADYRAEQDDLGDFIREECVVQERLASKASLLYGRYRSVNMNSGEEPMSQKRFGQALVERGFERYSNNGIWYRGLGLRADSSEEGWANA